ncbi:MAG: rod shape-determining protein MreD [Nocardioidaceae bacterium]
MSAMRGLGYAVLLGLAFVVQVTVFAQFTVGGVAPNLVLIVVVAAAIFRGPDLAMVLGFCGGLLLDLAPPADHLAGRWTLALVLTAFLVGRLRSKPASAFGIVGIVAAASFVASSLFVFSGWVLGDVSVSATEALRVILIGVCYDAALTPFVMPLLARLTRRLRPPRMSVA